MAPPPQARHRPDNISVILHRPAIPENIGSVARAMRNTGFSRLIISCPETEDWATAEKLAVSASDMLQHAPRCGSLEEAISLSEARYLVGTTGRDRKYWRSTDIGTAAPQILNRALAGGTALIFGPENTGLSNEELTLCHLTVTIPSKGELASYNLAQAVLLILYTLMTQAHPEHGPDLQEPAPFQEMEGMYSHIQEILTDSGFLWNDNPDHMMRSVREYMNRTVPTENEVKMIRGICRRLLYHLGNRDPETGKR